jgi:site-specific DNA-methyltransferase (adenine-specific)/modification methylase
LQPYYQDDFVTLYHGDCEEIISELPFGASLLLTDPPYGISYESNHNSGWKDPVHVRWRKHENFPGIIGDDKALDPQHLYFLAPLAAIFGGNYCAPALGASRCWIVWDKRVETTPDNQSDCEMVWTNFDRSSRIYRHLWRGLIRAGEENVSISGKLHPHQKPLGLLRFIIRYSGINSGYVVDPYCGSGSTLLAAKQLGFPSIGVEIDEHYCEVAAKRLQQTTEATA